MLTINEKSHVSTVIGSLDKIYKLAKMQGRLYPFDIYYLNIIYKLLEECHLSLSDKQRNCLFSLYSRLSLDSQYICPSKPIKKYQQTKQPSFFQAETTDCNTFTAYPKIFYWQEVDYTTVLADVQPLVDDTGYLTDKLFDTYAAFELGKTIPYSNIGRVCFLALESDTTSYEVRDHLNILVNASFDIVLIPAIHATLFVSKNVMSHGDMEFKIKKLA